MKGFIINDVCTCGRCGGAGAVPGAAVLRAHDEGRADGGAGDAGEVQPRDHGVPLLQLPLQTRHDRLKLPPRAQLRLLPRLGLVQLLPQHLHPLPAGHGRGAQAEDAGGLRGLAELEPLL